MKKIMSNILLFISCFSLLCGCNKSENKLSIYTNFYEQDISTFNYLLTNTHSDYIHIANFIDGLVENDKYGNIVPSIAKSWRNEIIDGKQIWTFNLRNDVYWSDYKGNKYSNVTADDFVTTIKYILNYNIRSNNYSLPISLIENAKGYYYATLIENYNLDEIEDKINQLSSHDPNSELQSYLTIKEAFDYCIHNLCSNNISDIGIKAINDYELQYTLTTPTPYFLSALTYCSFLPVNESFIKEVGINNFGTNKKNLLYNGAYILKDYLHSSKIEYIKNENYWDKNNVFIDKIVFNKLSSVPTPSYTRLAYETGNVDEFYVNQHDDYGWEKYVTGKDNKGTISDPVGFNTYYTNVPTDFTTFYIVFNQNRTSKNYSALSDEEIQTANLALKNTNFRKALIYGLERESYHNSYFTDLNTSIVPRNFISNNDKDYNDYLIEEYASNNNISYTQAYDTIQNNSLLNENLSTHYLDLALDELNINTPIKIEFSYFYSADYAQYDIIRIKGWNNILNGCDINSTNCNYNKVEIVYNSTLSTHNDFSFAVQNGEYSISIIGLNPNFVDPTAYLEAFSSNGELFTYLNHSQTTEIENALKQISYYYKEEDMEERFKLCAKLEYKILFELALVLPLSIKDISNKVVVSRLTPYQKMKATYGLSPYKFKFRKLHSQKFTQNDILKLKEEYEKGRNS